MAWLQGIKRNYLNMNQISIKSRVIFISILLMSFLGPTVMAQVDIYYSNDHQYSAINFYQGIDDNCNQDVMGSGENTCCTGDICSLYHCTSYILMGLSLIAIAKFTDSMDVFPNAEPGIYFSYPFYRPPRI